VKIGRCKECECQMEKGFECYAMDDDWRDENDKCQHHYCANETAVHVNDTNRCTCAEGQNMVTGSYPNCCMCEKIYTVVTPPPGSSPQPQEMKCSLNERRSFLNFTTKAHGVCVSLEAINQTSCSGNCYGQEEPTYEMTDNLELILGRQSCTCCRGTGIVVRIKVKCQQPDSYVTAELEVNIPYFNECSCRECPGATSEADSGSGDSGSMNH
jgi:hypothetical protein